MREQILSEIRRLAKANNGVPPGRRLFETETGIRESEWYGVYWPRWGDALTEAGFSPNAKNLKLDNQFIFAKLAVICRHYGKVPAAMEMRLYKKLDPDFPNEKTVLAHFGGKQKLLSSFKEWASQFEDYQDILVMLQDVTLDQGTSSKVAGIEGHVYLIRSGPHYKIGRSDEIERRVKSIKVALPEAATLVHSIRTDDPPGIEAYWHRRFVEKRANGEWFKLTASDIAAFKRRKFQ